MQYQDRVAIHQEIHSRIQNPSQTGITAIRSRAGIIPVGVAVHLQHGEPIRNHRVRREIPIQSLRDQVVAGPVRPGQGAIQLLHVHHHQEVEAIPVRPAHHHRVAGLIQPLHDQVAVGADHRVAAVHRVGAAGEVDAKGWIRA